MTEGKVSTDEIYNTIIENHNMTQLKINEILGIVQQRITLRNQPLTKRAHHQHQLIKAIKAIGVRKGKLTWTD